MESKDVKLHVENLKISFRTNDGKLQAVRNIGFDLMEGETLAIVGESGSGKSVTSKAILGILAGNSIVEDGSIIYDGKDLLKINEEDFHHIRGDKISMIFQDPMSSLNPIIRIGRQLTEAMILKGNARQKESRTNLNTYIDRLKKAMILACAQNDPAKKKEIEDKCRAFTQFEYKHLELEGEYNKAHTSAEETVGELPDLIVELNKTAAQDLPYRIKTICKNALLTVHKYVVSARADELKRTVEALRALGKPVNTPEYDSAAAPLLASLQDILNEALTYPMPNFFAMGYYVQFSGQPVPEMPVPDLNVFLRAYLDDHFMLDFLKDTEKALACSADQSYREKEEAIACLLQYRPVFDGETLDKKECGKAVKTLSKEVGESIDKLEIRKDSMICTFGPALEATVNKYFHGVEMNPKEEKRFAKETAKYEALCAKGKEPDWKVVAAAVTDLDATQKNILRQIDGLIGHYRELLAARETRNYSEEAVGMIDYLKACASGVVKKVTPSLAKNRAIKLMKEVGISEPRTRFKQYPFEFSGGMRQRIVIAIALAADPDILICDEPTTALDVTIQSQILELINDLKRERHLSVIFITHDLGVVANMADRIAVMYAGKIVEYGTAADVFYESAHPYTWALLSSMPDLDTNEKLEAIPGTPPDMHYPPVGDAFAARNKYAMEIDFEQQPPMFRISDTHYAATWLLHPDAPKVERPQVITDRIERMKKRREAQRRDKSESAE